MFTGVLWCLVLAAQNVHVQSAHEERAGVRVAAEELAWLATTSEVQLKAPPSLLDVSIRSRALACARAHFSAP